MENVHSDLIIEEDIETDRALRKVEEKRGDEEEAEVIRRTASFLLEEIFDKVVKKAKNYSLNVMSVTSRLYAGIIS